LQILLQLAIQGFIAIFLYALLQKIYSPFNGWYGYTSETPLGLTIRTPAIISLILFVLSTSLHDKLKILFNRFSNKPQTFGLSVTDNSTNKTVTSNAPTTNSDKTDNKTDNTNTNTNSK